MLTAARRSRVIIGYLAAVALLTVLDLATGGHMHGSVIAAIDWSGGFACAFLLMATQW